MILTEFSCCENLKYFLMISNCRLNYTYSQLLKETEILQMDHKNLKSVLNNSKLEQTRLEAEFSKLKEQYQQLDITSTKLNNQCEVSVNRLHHCFFLYVKTCLKVMIHSTVAALVNRLTGVCESHK